jgi:16S rRNA (cytidine1402-2'-O)-methyltransferase
MTSDATRAGTLSVVATPIGNLEDLSLRAARILRAADLVLAEDTRSARVLLNRVDALGVGDPPNPERRVKSLFDGNEVGRIDGALAALAAGAQVALISEAGTPGVSDPGARVIRAVIDAGHEVVVIPGPVAAIAALVASGLPTDQFLFVGFPPRDTGARQEAFGALRGVTATMIFYEAPDRVGATCADLALALGGDRRASLGRELTKIHEEHVRAPLAELAARYAETAPRGECTLIVAGAIAAPAVIDLEAELGRLLDSGLGPKDAAARMVVVTGRPRRQLYQLALSLARTRGTAG